MALTSFVHVVSCGGDWSSVALLPLCFSGEGHFAGSARLAGAALVSQQTLRFHQLGSALY